MAGGHRERGMATAELALVVPAVVLVLALCLRGWDWPSTRCGAWMRRGWRPAPHPAGNP